jgi:hypothetical protein
MLVRAGCIFPEQQWANAWMTNKNPEIPQHLGADAIVVA